MAVRHITCLVFSRDTQGFLHKVIDAPVRLSIFYCWALNLIYVFDCIAPCVVITNNMLFSRHCTYSTHYTMDHHSLLHGFFVGLKLSSLTPSFFLGYTFKIACRHGIYTKYAYTGSYTQQQNTTKPTSINVAVGIVEKNISHFQIQIFVVPATLDFILYFMWHRFISHFFWVFTEHEVQMETALVDGFSLPQTPNQWNI